MKKTTLQDMRDILVDSKEGSDRHFWGVVTRQNRTASGDVTSYEVALGGDEGTMTCRKLAGANVGDTVMVTLTKTGMAVVTGTVDGDKDAEAAMTTAEAAQGAVDTLSETVDTLSDDVDSIEGLVGDGDETGITITTQYYLSTSNTTQTGGTWSDTLPAYVAGRYYWTKTITTYADGSEVESTPILDIASQLTAEVNSVVTAENQHFWHDNTGAYVTTANQSYTSGYAMKITSYGLLQTYNGNNLMSLTTSGLTFYQSNGSTPMATYSSGGAYLYAGGNIVGSFTTSGATIGETSSGKANIYIHTSGSNTLYEFRNGTSTLGSIEGSYLGYFQFNSSGGFRFLVGSTDAFGVSSSRVYSNIPTSIYSTLSVSSSFSVTDSITASGTITGNSRSDAIVADYGSIKNLWAVTNASSDAVNMHIGTQGRIYKTTNSSKRFKNSISEIKLDELDPRHLYDIEVNQFKYNKDYIKNQKDVRYDSFVPGFIAEQMYEHYPVAVDLDDEGRPNDWNMKFIIPPMLALIQEQKKEIDSIREELADIKKLIA